MLCQLYMNCQGYAVAQLVTALRYKLEGHITNGVTRIFH